MTSVATYLRLPADHPNAAPIADEIEQFVIRQGWQRAASFRDLSGTDAASTLISAMRSHLYSAVVVHRVDHLFRSLHAFCVCMLELDLSTFRFVALADGIDTAAPSTIAEIVAAFANVERSAHREASLRAMARAQRHGARIGRPPARFPVARALRMRERGLSIESIAAELGISAATVSRRLADLSKPLS